ncbi:MAG TPA: M1 family aminopeptidase [Blastocatellia bacterium]|nr:M1 family aminopeptidase [Blastocatellia bacterium]
MKRAACFALALTGLIFTVAFSRDTYPRATALDAIHYRIHLEINDAGDDISAETEILFAFNNDSVKSIALDFAGLRASEVTENKRAAQFAQSDGHLNIRLQGDYARGDRCSIAVKYQGKPGDGLFFKKNKFGDRTIFADNWPNRARHWFPAIDHPYDKATVEFFVTAPDRYDVIANGVLVETTRRPGGAKLTHWSEKVPIPTYCMVIGATNFSIVNAGSWNSIPLSYYLYPKDRERGIKDFGRALRMIEFYSNLIGPYPYEKLALVQSSTRFGGMENSSNIFFDQNAFDGSGKLEGTVAHEIAHQWFGDSVTEADWHHLWLSEGFATYFGALFFERADGRDRFIKLMLANKESYLKQYAGDPRPIYDPAITDLFSLLNANNYQKGAWVLHMLRHLMGDEKFFAGIRDYYRTYRDRNALTVDFQRVMESHAGRGLDWFFREWFNEPGYPVYEAGWRWDERAKELRLRVTQRQQKTVFVMPLDVEIKLGGGARREVAEVSEREQVFTFKLDRKPDSVAIDPDEWVLKVLNLKEEK